LDVKKKDNLLDILVNANKQSKGASGLFSSLILVYAVKARTARPTYIGKRTSAVGRAVRALGMQDKT